MEKNRKINHNRWLPFFTVIGICLTAFGLTSCQSRSGLKGTIEETTFEVSMETLTDGNKETLKKYVSKSLKDKKSTRMYVLTNVYVYNGPGSEYDIIGELDLGSEVIKLSDLGQFTCITCDDIDKGYIMSTSLSFKEPFP